MRCLFSDTRATSAERNSAGAPGKRAGDAHTVLGQCVCVSVNQSTEQLRLLSCVLLPEHILHEIS